MCDSDFLTWCENSCHFAKEAIRNGAVTDWSSVHSLQQVHTSPFLEVISES